MTSKADQLQKLLKDNFQGELHVDRISRQVYSVDASIYEVTPLAIALPKTTTSLEMAVKAARELGISITSRGAATGITGGALGEGLIIDTSKYLTRIIKIDLEKQTVLVEPGVVQDTLNEALSPYGFRLGPDTSTGNRATLGGMLANNAAGSRSLFFGSMRDHVESVKLLLASGKTLCLKPLTEKEWVEKCHLEDEEGKIFRELTDICQNHRKTLESLPKTPRCSSGYSLQWLNDKFPLNPCKLLAGSEGTLGVMTEIEMKISPKLRPTGLCLLHFEDQERAFSIVQEILSFSPISLEMIDRYIIEAGKNSSQFCSQLGTPSALLIVELEEGKLQHFFEEAKKRGFGTRQMLIQDPSTVQEVINLRKAGLGLLLSKRSYTRAIAFIEDLAIPPVELASFMRKFSALLTRFNKQAGIYGHVGAGCLHIRPYINLKNPQEILEIPKMMEEVLTLILEHEGVLSGEHGDGFIRSWLNPRLFGKEAFHLFERIKKAFDPEGLMNPSKIVGGKYPLERLRFESPIQEIDTFQSFEEEGGFSLSADLCNGNGACRKGSGLMCPSFQATKDECDTTRARAQALRGVIQGKFPIGEEVLSVLDLCLECKGCKTECPSHVDMAKMKAEMLYQYQKKRGVPLRSRLFGNIGEVFHLFSSMPRIFNGVNTWALTKRAFSFLGVSKERNLPLLAKSRFSSWFQKHSPLKSNHQVVLFVDTYTEFLEPHIGKAAVHVLENLGFQVLMVPWQCCGRPFISKGLLQEAKKTAEKLFRSLKLFQDQGIPIIGLEPSCLFTLKDDFPILIGEKMPQAVTFDAFIADQVIDLKGSKAFHIHTHCHQKALQKENSTSLVLNKIKGAKVFEIPSGCCGMAGSFGYEKEHYPLSMAIGELVLFPWIRNLSQDDVIVANGFSCRSQIAHGTPRVAKHLAEVLTHLMQN